MQNNFYIIKEKIMKNILIIFGLLFNLSAHADTKVLDKQDKRTIHKIIENVLKELFLLETTKYNSKKLKKKLLGTLPEQIFWEISYTSKYDFLEHNIWLGKRDKDTLVKSRRSIENIECHYIEDNSIDCNIKEKYTKYYRKQNTPKLFESFGGADYKFNLTVNDKGTWKINKIKVYTIKPLPKLSTLQIDAQEEQERLNPKISSVEDIPEEERPSMEVRGSLKGVGESRRQTALLSEEEEAVKEEQESMLHEIQEYNKKHNHEQPLVDRNGNRLTPPASTNSKTFE